MTSCNAEIDTLIQTFMGLWREGKSVNLHLRAKAGKAFAKLELGVHRSPAEGTTSTANTHPPYKNSRQRRRQRRRAEKQSLTNDTEKVSGYAEKAVVLPENTNGMDRGGFSELESASNRNRNKTHIQKNNMEPSPQIDAEISPYQTEITWEGVQTYNPYRQRYPSEEPAKETTARNNSKSEITWDGVQRCNPYPIHLNNEESIETQYDGEITWEGVQTFNPYRQRFPNES